MRANPLIGLGAAALGASTLAGGAAPADPPVVAPAPAALGAADLAAAQNAADCGNAFGFALFNAIAATSGDRNVFVSPTSIYQALSMVYNGAHGATRAAMAKSLALPDDADLKTVNAANAALMRSATESGDPGVTLSIANALWADSGAPFAPDFVERCAASYHAGVQNLSFRQADAAARTINAWVSEHTNQKIPSIISPMDLKSDTDAVLTNAVYFKGDWKQPFRPQATKEAPFHRTAAAGGDKVVPMMHALLHTGYIKTDDFEAVRLPYSTGRFSLCAFLPAIGSNPTTLAASLTPDLWQKCRDKFADPKAVTLVRLQLPRFKMSFAAPLKQPLTQLGLGLAFQSSADFSGMGLRHEHIGEVLHKAVLEVNEAGSEAAAATAVIMRRSAAIQPISHAVVFDRPFVCAIVDDQTGAVLFEGIVNDPE